MYRHSVLLLRNVMNCTLLVTGQEPAEIQGHSVGHLVTAKESITECMQLSCTVVIPRGLCPVQTARWQARRRTCTELVEFEEAVVHEASSNRDSQQHDRPVAMQPRSQHVGQ